jgi:hypothetical protein
MPKVPEPVFKLLTAAATRRNVSASSLATAIITGVILKGSIDRAANGWLDQDVTELSAKAGETAHAGEV